MVIADRLTHQPNVACVHRALGLLLLVHFTAVCAIKSAQGNHADVWWMSHVALGLAGVGLLIGSRLLAGAALTAVAIPHAVWLLDFAIAQVHSSAALGITRYLDGADLPTWLATAHHLYLVPLLLLIAWRQRYYYDSLLLAIVLTAGATLLSRAVLPVSRNVNWAHATMPDADLAVLHELNHLPAAMYLAILLTGQVLVMMLPTALLLRWWTRNRPAAYSSAPTFDERDPHSTRNHRSRLSVTR